MGQHERLYKLKHLFASGGCYSLPRLQRELEVSAATLKRDIAHLRERMNAPIVHDRERGGWRLDRYQPSVGVQYKLPATYTSTTLTRSGAAMVSTRLTTNVVSDGSSRASCSGLIVSTHADRERGQSATAQQRFEHAGLPFFNPR